MKTTSIIPAILGGLILIPTAAQAQRAPGEGGDRRDSIRGQLLAHFDKNKDGKLDESERPTREQIQQFLNTRLGNGTNRDRVPGAGARPGEGRRPGGRPGEGGAGGRAPR